MSVILEVSYTAFKYLIEKWPAPYIYFPEGRDLTIITVNTIPTLKAVVEVESVEYTDFITTLQPTADALILYDPVTRVPIVKVQT